MGKSKVTRLKTPDICLRAPPVGGIEDPRHVFESPSRDLSKPHSYYYACTLGWRWSNYLLWLAKRIDNLIGLVRVYTLVPLVAIGTLPGDIKAPLA